MSLTKVDLRADFVCWLHVNSWVAGGKSVASVRVEVKQSLSLPQETHGRTEVELGAHAGRWFSL